MIKPSECAAVCGIYACARHLQHRIQKLKFALENKRHWNYESAERERRLRAHIGLCKTALAQLDNNSNIKPTIKAVRSWLPIAEVLTRLTGQSFVGSGRSMSDFEKTLMESMKLKSQEARLSELRGRIALELAEKAEKGWFIVFNTLTVTDDTANRVFKKGSTEWQQYLRKIDRELKKRIYGKATAKVCRSEYHSYIGVVERGSKGTRRLHLHVLHCFMQLPCSTNDPNAGLANPNRRQVNMGHFWRNGYSTPIAVRTHHGDAYGKIGWCWPNEKVAGVWKPLKSGSIGKVAAYVAKYTTKTRKAKQWFRTRTSKNYGMYWMKSTVRNMTTEQLKISLETMDWTPAKVQGVSLPKQATRYLMIKELMNRILTTRNFTELKTFRVDSQAKGLIQQLREDEKLSRPRVRTISRTKYMNIDPLNLRGTEYYEAMAKIRATLKKARSPASAGGAGTRSSALSARKANA